jgi:RNA polymerase sigma factor (sigma-70 family)
MNDARSAIIVPGPTKGVMTTTGDDRAFDDFYRAHRRDAVRWATALVGDPAVGEELAQEALLAVGRRLGGIDAPGAYLRRAVVHRAASWHRWHGRELRRVHRLAAERVHAQTSDDWSGPTREVLAALAPLPYRQRAAITLRFWADWSDEQIAAALGCAPTTVRVHVHRGLAALRGVLAAADHEEDPR